MAAGDEGLPFLNADRVVQAGVAIVVVFFFGCETSPTLTELFESAAGGVAVAATFFFFAANAKQEIEMTKTRKTIYFFIPSSRYYFGKYSDGMSAV